MIGGSPNAGDSGLGDLAALLSVIRDPAQAEERLAALKQASAEADTARMAVKAERAGLLADRARLQKLELELTAVAEQHAERDKAHDVRVAGLSRTAEALRADRERVERDRAANLAFRAEQDARAAALERSQLAFVAKTEELRQERHSIGVKVNEVAAMRATLAAAVTRTEDVRALVAEMAKELPRLQQRLRRELGNG